MSKQTLQEVCYQFFIKGNEKIEIAEKISKTSFSHDCIKAVGQEKFDVVLGKDRTHKDDLSPTLFVDTIIPFNVDFDDDNEDQEGLVIGFFSSEELPEAEIKNLISVVNEVAKTVSEKKPMTCQKCKADKIYRVVKTEHYKA